MLFGSYSTREFRLNIFLLVGLFLTFVWPISSASAQNQNAYFETLAAGPGVLLAKSCRSQAELDADAHGDPVVYDATVDAARTDVEEDNGGDGDADSGPRYTFSGVTSGQVWYVFDMMVHEDFLGILGGVNTFKMFQLASDGIDPIGDDRRLEIRTHFNILNPEAATPVANPGGAVDTRPYISGVETGYLGRLEPINASESLNFRERYPYVVSLGKWNRYWAMADIDNREYSLWVADEDRDAVNVYNRASVPGLASLNGFWWEFDTSQARTGPAGIFGWFRNLVVLHNVTPSFDRPLGSGAPNPRPSAPANLRQR